MRCMARRSLRIDGLRIVVVAAHPDDGELGCGGFLLWAADEGAQTIICVLGDGCAGGNARLREQEARQAAEALGADLIQAGLPDTRIPLRPAIKIVERLIAAVEPHVVLVHTPADTHQDHRVSPRESVSSPSHLQNLAEDSWYKWLAAPSGYLSTRGPVFCRCPISDVCNNSSPG
ncbi:MAG: hypothetical protein GXX96_00665 [Planctomycetaceae bacterium]|nr:hypothetical protein [Planctomycetaceae bacterium]